MIAFVSNEAESRADLRALLASHSRAVELLRWTRQGQERAVRVDQFVQSDAGNFLARYRPLR